jgi:hypothetical protein
MQKEVNMLRGILSNIDARVGASADPLVEISEELLEESAEDRPFTDVLERELKREKNG